MLRGTEKVNTSENMRLDEEKGKIVEQPSPDSEPLINGSDKKEEKVASTSSTGISGTGLKVLALLAVQNCSKNLIMRAAVKDKPDFLYSAAVIGSELTKFTLSTLFILCYERGSIQSIITFLKQDWWNMVLLMVPAGVYNLQQTLEYVALSNLDAALFSVLVQVSLARHLSVPACAELCPGPGGILPFSLRGMEYLAPAWLPGCLAAWLVTDEALYHSHLLCAAAAEEDAKGSGGVPGPPHRRCHARESPGRG